MKSFILKLLNKFPQNKAVRRVGVFIFAISSSLLILSSIPLMLNMTIIKGASLGYSLDNNLLGIYYDCLIEEIDNNLERVQLQQAQQYKTIFFFEDLTENPDPNPYTDLHNALGKMANHERYDIVKFFVLDRVGSYLISDMSYHDTNVDLWTLLIEEKGSLIDYPYVSLLCTYKLHTETNLIKENFAEKRLLPLSYDNLDFFKFTLFLSFCLLILSLCLTFWYNFFSALWSRIRSLWHRITYGK